MNARPTPGTRPIHLQSAHSALGARSLLVIAVPALLAGAALGYFVPRLFSRAPEPVEETEEAKVPEKRPARPQPAQGTDAELRRLRALNRELHAKIEDLERQLAEQGTAAAEEPIEQPATNHAEGRRRFGPPTFAELEEMRQNNPERYVQETNRIAQFRAGWQGQLQNQFDILASADTTHMTAKQRQVHEDYVNLLARIDELGEQLNPLADIPEEQRRAAGQEMRETWRQLHELQRLERDTLLTQTANALGFRGRKAQEVVEGIKQVYEATGGGPWGRGGGRGRGPGGGGRGRR